MTLSMDQKIELEKETLKRFKQLRREFFQAVINYAEKTAKDPLNAKTDDFNQMLHLTTQFCEMLLHEINDLVIYAAPEKRLYRVEDDPK